MQAQERERSNETCCRLRRGGRTVACFALAGIVVIPVVRRAAAQNGQTGSELRLGIAEIPTPLSKPPDANVQMALQARKKAIFRFDAANALRKKQIEEESARLLQLARDLKAEMDEFGDGPLPGRLVREAEVIELLAHDVQARMVLTVGGG